jgi:hypothetical protein
MFVSRVHHSLSLFSFPIHASIKDRVVLTVLNKLTFTLDDTITFEVVDRLMLTMDRPMLAMVDRLMIMVHRPLLALVVLFIEVSAVMLVGKTMLTHPLVLFGDQLESEMLDHRVVVVGAVPLVVLVAPR